LTFHFSWANQLEHVLVVPAVLVAISADIFFQSLYFAHHATTINKNMMEEQRKSPGQNDCAAGSS
jgi:hypothetical protein